MIDKPLYENPLAGGSGQLGGLSFRQEGDMGRYVADNDPGGIAAGFSNLEDFLAAGNKLPKQKTLNDLLGVSNANFNVSPPGTLKLDPQATLNMLGSNITAPGQIPDRYKEGFADFYKQNPDDYMRMGGQAVSYVTTPQGETIQFGDTGSASNFRRYLESIGETPKANENLLSTNLLKVAGSPEMGSASPQVPFQPGFDSQENPFIERGDSMIPDNNAFPIGFGSGDSRDITSTFPNQGVGQDVFGNNPMEIPVPSNPFNRVGQQLTGLNENGSVLETLKNIEQGIASLGGNFGQGNNMNQSSNYGDFDNFGIGSFYPPYGGMYG